MLPYYPLHVPDELLYSHLGRYRALNASGPIRGFLLGTFGSATCIPSADLPTRLQALVSQLEHNAPYASLEQAVSLTTLYPYHRLFMPSDRWARLLAAAGADVPANVKMFTGLVAQRFGASVRLRSCSQCMRETWQRYGCTCWLRAHQLPGVRVCAHHGCQLDEHFVQSLASHRQELRACPFPTDAAAAGPGMNALESPVDIPSSVGEPQWRFARLSRQALELGATDILAPDVMAVVRAYRQTLAERGYGRGRNQIRWERLSNDLLMRFDGFRDWPVTARLGTVTHGSLGWIHGLLCRPERLSHPMCHLLLIDMLYGSLDAWLCAVDETSGIETPQASCNRPAPVHVAADTVPGSIFCGMETLLRDSSLSCRSIAALADLETTTVVQMRRRLGIDVPRRSKHLSPSLIEIARARLARAEPIEVAARSLGLSASTLYRILASDPQTHREREQAFFAQQGDLHRRSWLAARKLSPNASTTEIRQQAPASYAWLYRHQRAWLTDNCAPARKRSPPVRVNWSQRSVHFARATTKTSSQLRSDTQRKVRVSPSALVRKIGPPTTITRNLHRMPELRLALQQGSESVQAFQALRVGRICSALSHAFGEPAPWRVMRIAGLRVLPSIDINLAILR